jgi:hypothetical protein
MEKEDLIPIKRTPRWLFYLAAVGGMIAGLFLFVCAFSMSSASDLDFWVVFFYGFCIVAVLPLIFFLPVIFRLSSKLLSLDRSDKIEAGVLFWGIWCVSCFVSGVLFFVWFYAMNIYWHRN